MEKLDTDKSVLLVSRETLGTLFKGYNEWNSLTVKMTDADEAKLVRGELASILEIPRGKKAIASRTFEHPFRLSLGESDTISISEGRIQLVNYSAENFVLVESVSIAPYDGDFIWVRVTQSDAEIPAPPLAEIDFGPEIPSDAREHKLVYAVFVPYIEGGSGATEVPVVESQTFIHYYILGRIESGEPVQWLLQDIIEKWAPVIEVVGTATTIA